MEYVWIWWSMYPAVPCRRLSKCLGYYKNYPRNYPKYFFGVFKHGPSSLPLKAELLNLKSLVYSPNLLFVCSFPEREFSLASQRYPYKKEMRWVVRRLRRLYLIPVVTHGIYHSLSPIISIYCFGYLSPFPLLSASHSRTHVTKL